MTWILNIMRPFARVTVAKVAQATWNTLEIGAGLLWTNDPTNQRAVLGVDPNAAQSFASAVISALTVTTITQGNATTKTGSASTTGAASAPVLTFPLANGHAASLTIEAAGRSPAGPNIFSFARIAQQLRVETSALDTGSAAVSFAAGDYGLPCDLSPSWSAGVLTATVTGPTTAISAAANNGGGKVQLTVAGPITSALTGKSVTVAGLSTCIEANGAHVATFVDATHMDFLAVAIAHPGADAGTAVLTTAPVIAWQAVGRLLVTP